MIYIKKKNNKWKEIWDRKGRLANCQNLKDLITLNGHQSPTSDVKVKDWIKYTNYFIKRFNIKKKDNILEIGCGAGAFLLPFFKKKINCFGIDFSKELIKHSKKNLKSSNFYVGEATNLKRLKQRDYSYIFANSLFQYFPTEGYAKRVLNEIFSLANDKTKIFLLDIPDKKKYKNWEMSVIRNTGKKNFSQKYKKAKHRFYEKNFFLQYCKSKGYKIKITAQNLIKKENSKFRYNIILKK